MSVRRSAPERSDTHSVSAAPPLVAGGFRLAAVMLGVRLCGLCSVMRGVVKMPLCGVRVVRSGLVVPFLVVSRSLAMMMGRVLVMFSSLVMMLGSVFGHCFLPRSLVEHGPLGRSDRLALVC